MKAASNWNRIFFLLLFYFIFLVAGVVIATEIMDPDKGTRTCCAPVKRIPRLCACLFNHLVLSDILSNHDSEL